VEGVAAFGVRAGGMFFHIASMSEPGAL